MGKTIRIFDFDETLTKNHTFRHPDAYAPDINIKKGVDAFFSHDNDDVAAIATFHNKPSYIKSYVEKILGKKLTLLKVENGTHHQVSIYSVQGVAMPLMIATIQANEYQKHLAYLKQNGKNTQINAILNHLSQSGVAVNSATVKFYDDSYNNFKMSSKLSSNAKAVESYHVSSYGDTFKIIDAIPSYLKPAYSSDSGTDYDDDDLFDDVETSLPNPATQEQSMVMQRGLENDKPHSFFSQSADKDSSSNEHTLPAQTPPFTQ
jgi:hypothetical protein